MLDGELRVLAGEEEHTAGPGTVAILPRRLRHACVVTSATARFLLLHTPGGFEQFAAEAGEPARALTLPQNHRTTRLRRPGSGRFKIRTPLPWTRTVGGREQASRSPVRSGGPIPP